MKKEQVIKMIIFLFIVGVAMVVGLTMYLNVGNNEPAKITLNMAPYKTSNITISLPMVTGDEQIAKLIDKKNAYWKNKAYENDLKNLTVTTTYYDKDYLSLFYSGISSSGNKIASSVVVNLKTRKEMTKSEIVEVVIRSKFEAAGKEDPKIKYSNSTFNQFDFIYLEKGTDNTVNGVFCWRNKNSTKLNFDKLNGFEIIKSIA